MNAVRHKAKPGLCLPRRPGCRAGEPALDFDCRFTSFWRQTASQRGSGGASWQGF